MLGTQYINLVLQKKDYSLIKGVRDIDDLFIIPTEKAVLDFIKDHWDKYGIVPDQTTLLRKYPEFDLMEIEESPEAILHDLREQLVAHRLKPILQKTVDLYNADSVQAVNYLQNELTRIEDLIYRGDTPFDYAQAGDIRLKEYLEVAEKEGLNGVPVGLPTFDEVMHCFGNGHLNLIGARLNVGKSWEAGRQVVTAWKAGKKVALFCLESNELEFSYRIDSLVDGFSNYHLFKGEMNERELERWKQYLQDLKTKNPLYIFTNKQNGGKRWKPSDVARVVEEYGLEFVVLDQLSQMEDDRRSRTIREQYISISDHLKSYAQDLNIPINLLAQLNREAAKKRGRKKKDEDDMPGIETFAESDGPAQYADRVIIMHEVPPLMKYALVKNRHGERDVQIVTKWRVNNGIIEEMASRSAEDQF